MHLANLAHFRSQAPPEQAHPVNTPSNKDIINDATHHLLAALSGRASVPYLEEARHNSPPLDIGIDWHLMEARDEGHLSMSAEQQAVTLISQRILEHFDLPASDEESDECLDTQSEPGNEPEVVVINDPADHTPDACPHKHHAQDQEWTSHFWFPWPDCIVHHLLVSLKHTMVNNVDNVPSVKSMQTLNLALQKMCRIDSIPYDSALGHKCVLMQTRTSLLCAKDFNPQEMANPKVQPHLSFYPEDSGTTLSEAHQGQCWLKELPDDIYGPALLQDGRCCMEAVVNETHSGWHIIKSEDFVVPATKFLKDFVLLQNDAHEMYGSLNPSHIIDIVDMKTLASALWTYTNPMLGNCWRAKAQGSRCVVFPVWLYCDDTSGNVSKKWNEHNSFLMTPAGLPHEQSQNEYNIHFLSRSEGIWAWNAVLQEPVLVIPEVLALLGDNPMQSEFACHIGLRGKLFCHAGWVKGTDVMDADDGGPGPKPPGRRDDGDGSSNSDAGSAAGSEPGSDHLDASTSEAGGDK
ncbi:hypothetical protein B0H10DRAFT_1960571 [Mycena sp. CBHHK59/15]|nr:hypothetical protein B0H10DRAFT_1960571 [Mycena sp. CBHHK59/15]